jgi:hypothetical protein
MAILFLKSPSLAGVSKTKMVKFFFTATIGIGGTCTAAGKKYGGGAKARFLKLFHQNRLNQKFIMKLLKYLFIAVCLTTLCVPESAATGGNPDNPLPWVAMRPFPQFAVPEFESAYAYIPEGVLHPLRVLGLSTGCTNWNTHNHSGLKPDGIRDPALEQSVCALIDSLPSTFQSAFLTLDYCMYPPLTFIDQGKAHDKAFECMVDKVKNEYNATYYLLIGKQINPADASVEFRVALELPRSGAFSNMNTTLENGFQQKVLEAITNKYATLQDLTDLPKAEKAGIDELARLIGLFLDGGFGGEITEELLDLNGFEIVPFNSEPEMQRTGTKTLNTNLKDYTGLKVNYPLAGGFVTVASQFQSAIDSTSLPIGLILTDNINYDSLNGVDFESANNAFKAFDRKVVLWIHYFQSSDSSQNKTIYLKWKSNLEEPEADSLLNIDYQQFIAGNTGARGLNCPSFTFSTSWRAEAGLLPCIDTFAIFNNNFLFPTQGVRTYVTAAFCGVIDGFIETVLFLYTAANFKEEIESHIPFTFSWIKTLVSEVRKKGSLAAGISEKLANDKKYWSDAYTTIKGLVEIILQSQLSCFIEDVVNGFKNWIEQLAFVEGTKVAGYALGKIVFELILTILTDGAYQVGKIANLTENGIKTVINAIKGGQSGMRGLLDNAWATTADVARKHKCSLLLGGCFVERTLVWTSNGLLPIDQLYPVLNLQNETDFLDALAPQAIPISNLK